MGSGKVCCITGEFAMLVSLGDARRRQQSLVPRPQLAIAPRHPTVSGRTGAGGKRLPACPLTQRANLRRCLDQLQPSYPRRKLYGLTLHLGDRFLQVPKAKVLCTTCEGVVRPVDGRGKPRLYVPDPAPPAPIRERGVRNRLRARIFTVDILRGERRIPPSGFPTQTRAFALPVACWE
jgi:hypothetical protein